MTKFSWHLLNDRRARKGVLLDGEFFPASKRIARIGRSKEGHHVDSLRGLAHLEQWLRVGSTDQAQWRLSVSEVERFEQMLCRRAALPARQSDQLTLFHAALQEVNICRWRARRFGIASEEWDFAIDLPRFVLACASDLLDSGQDTNSSSHREDLAYLDLVATCILAAEQPPGKARASTLKCVVLPVSSRHIRDAFLQHGSTYSLAVED